MDLNKKEIKPDVKEIVKLFRNTDEIGRQFIYSTALAVNMVKTTPKAKTKPEV